MRFLVLLVSLIAAASSAPSTETFVPMLDGRIVGGDPVDIEEYNYQASLLYFGSHRCGAVIISADVVLTAAHCTYEITAALLQIRAGSSIRNNGGVVVSISQLYEHPSFVYATLDYDISVLRLASPLSFSAAIGVIALPAPDYPEPVGELSVITGWGTLTEGGSAATQLQAVRVPVVSIAECRASYGTNSVTDRMICAGVPEGGLDACQGDSGGPLVVGDLLIGLVSWGAGCARPGFPGVYASVPNLRGYITETVGL